MPIQTVARFRRLHLPIAAMGLYAASALAAPNNVVISQFRVDGPSGGNDEFVEIYNSGSASVDISGWLLQGCSSSSGTASTRATVPAAHTLASGQYYLFGNSSSGGYSGTVTADQTYATGFSNSGKSGIRIVNASGVKQDGVGLTGATDCVEGTPMTTIAGSAGNYAYVRANGGTQDTDNNAADFSGPGASNPHNSGGTVVKNDHRIYEVQGRAHLSPLNGQYVTNVPGIVTQLSSNGFYLQDPDGDGDPATSDAAFVFTSKAPTVAVGELIKVSATVSEYRVAGAATNLTTTELTGPTIVDATGQSLFTHSSVVPTVIGLGGRVPPVQYIDSDSAPNVESASHVFDPNTNGIDFYESLEGMLVQVNGGRVIGPTSKYGEIWLLTDGGSYATGLNARGGISLVDRGAQGVDYNPERVMIDTSLLTSTYPQASVGDTVSTVTGVMDYDFGDYRLYPQSLPTITAGNLQPQTATLDVGGDRLSIAAYNVDNLDANDADICDGAPDMDVANGRFTRLGQHIALNLNSPDIISIEEIQDNDGCTDDGVVDPATTMTTLLQAIQTAGGPLYQYVEIDPVNDQDGGVPGGNIRQVIVYNPQRVSFVPGTAGAGDSVTATAVQSTAGKLTLSLSPGRISPNDAAWSTSRKPLAATFDFNGRRLLIISNHFDSKGGDQPLYGPVQPPVLSSATQRVQQAQIVHDFIAQALSLQPGARIVTLGDFNDFAFSTPMQTLTGDSSGQPILTDLAGALLPPEENYSYIYEGNSQEIDHIYVTSALMSSAEYQPVHVNSEFVNQVSDHDPMLASLEIAANQPPVANAGSSQSVTTGASVTLDGSGSHDADGSIASYQWTQTSGPAVSLGNAAGAVAGFTAPSTSATLGFQLTVTDNDGATATASVTVTVQAPNQPPVANAGPDQTARRYFRVTLNGTGSSDADGSIVSYQWTQLSGPSVKLFNYATATPYFNAAGKVGTVYSFQLTVTDNQGAKATDSVNVTVKPIFGATASATSDAMESLLGRVEQEWSERVGD